ncbi:MAG: amidohydrolase family protein [Gemmatimonadetes bacterium]|nr:amidohydrolase family protein [Gemmatimonadota bacterium]
MRRIGSCLAALALALSVTDLGAQDLLVVGGHVVDVESRSVRTENLLISDGEIVGTPTDVPAGFDGEIVDASGRWVLPGLVDLHTHSFGNRAPVEGAMEFAGTVVTSQRMLYAGVTAFLDLFGLEDQIFFMRDAQRENPTPGADIHAAGPCLTAPEGHCSEYGIPTRLMSTPDEAREQVEELAAKDPDVVKIVYAPAGRMPSVDRATMTAAVLAASSHGIPTVIHVQDWDDIRHAALAGATAVTHVPEEDVIPDDVLALMAERGVASIPTLAVHLGVSGLTTHPEWLDSPLAVGVTSASIRDAYRSSEITPGARRWRDRQIETGPTILESVRRMHESGIRVLVGTDSGNPGTIQGWSVHHELMKLVAAGLDPWDALAAGTTNAAAFLDRAYGVGIGDAANLILLDASPLEDIRNTQRISDVIHRGQRMDRDALKAG